MVNNIKISSEDKISLSLKMSYLGVFSSLAIAISYFEAMLPTFPFFPPGAKLGLSNIVNMFVLEKFNFTYAITICILKSFFILITRGTTAFLMSITGGVFSIIIMYILFKFRKHSIGLISISIIGAIFHNLGQLLVTALITSGSVFYYIPILMFFSLITGTLTGFILQIVMPSLNKI